MENYQIRDVAGLVQEIVPNSVVRYAEGAGPDTRCYQVDCGKIERTVPGYQPRWTVRDGIEELYNAYISHGLDYETFVGPRFLRIKEIKRLQEQGQVDGDLRWTSVVV
jgi:hypothetical protein